MAPNQFSTMLHRRTNKITRVLTYAILEWTLIFFLLLNSLFSYFILKFALYFGLKPPCILCSRIDHVLDSHKRKKHSKSTFSSYTDFICEQHAAEISRIGYCSNHRKLVESQNMCNDCSSSPSSSHDPQVFKWMTEIGIVKDDTKDDAAKKCSCCDRVISPIISNVSSLDFVIKERELVGDCFSDQKVQVTSDHSDDHKFEYQALHDGTEEEESEEDVILEAEKQPLLDDTNDNNGKNNEEIATTHNLCPDMLPQHLEFYIGHDDYKLIPIEMIDDDSIKVESKGEDTSSVVGKEEMKDCSELYREFDLVFEGDELVIPGCEVITTKNLPSIQEEEESVIENIQIPKDEEKMDDSDKFELVLEGGDLVADCEIISKSLPKEEESAIENLQTHKDEEEEEKEESQISQPQQEEEKERKIENSLPSEEQEVTALTEGKTISQEQESDSQAIEGLEADSQATAETLSTPPEEQEETALTEGQVLSQEQESNNQAIEGLEADTQATTETLSTLSEPKEDSAYHLKNDETDTEEKNQNLSDTLLTQESEEDVPSHLRNYEIEIETVKNQNSTDELLIEMDEPPKQCKQEIHTFTDNVASEVSTSCPPDAEISEKSLNVNVAMSHNEVEEERNPDTPTSLESLSHLNKKLMLLGRRESATEESLDEMSMISEQDSGETMEKLKVDLLTERKALRTLYKELEEERNAAAIAANQTMAMITRLQEEKATMHMEALQYQRMMEEQAEYDQEALQMMNELMVKREKEKQELEKELEVYRKKVMDYEEKERIRVLCRRRSRNSSASCSYGEESDGLSVDLNQEAKDQEEDGGSPHSQEENGLQDTPTDAVLCLQDSLVGFEEERHAILEQLKVLEGKLFTLAEEEEEHFESMQPFEQFYEENGKDFDANGGDNNGFIHANGKHQHERKMNGSMQKRLLPLFDATELLESPNEELNGNADDLHITKFELEKKRFAIEEEVDLVYERLQALEADREFLKHCIGSLRKGDKGLDLLQEILQHLRDLKNVEVQATKNMDQCASV